MNLARVEYYFAKFLSAMEVRARTGAALIELGPDLVVELPPNLRFIGTINIDETTHGFSDKVYDRAQLIEMYVTRGALNVHLGQVPYRDLLLEIWDAIAEVAPFAFRIIDEIGRYTDRATELGVPWEEALDEQVLQKLLPKLKGADPRVGQALEQMKRVIPNAFSMSQSKLTVMLERARLHGFTSFF
jgi:hypothetical protein